jgi:hypothetical protein
MTGFDPNRLLIPLVALMVIVLIYSNRLTSGKARETSNGLVFSLKSVYSWSRMLLLPAYMAFFLWLSWRQSHAISWPLVALCVVALAIGLLQMPGTITLTPMAVTQHYWLLPSTAIPYGEVKALQAIHGGRTILVLGDKRARIRHSANHVAAADFRREIERRTGQHVIH